MTIKHLKTRIKRLENLCELKSSVDIISEESPEQLEVIINFCKKLWKSFIELKLRSNSFHPSEKLIGEPTEPVGLSLKEKEHFWLELAAEVHIAFIIQTSYSKMGYENSKRFLKLAALDPVLAPILEKQTGCDSQSIKDCAI